MDKIEYHRGIVLLAVFLIATIFSAILTIVAYGTEGSIENKGTSNPGNIIIIPICTNPYGQLFPDIFADKIVWEDERNGNGDIYMYDLSTSTEKRITTDPNKQRSPAIYGDKIVWCDSRNGPPNIYMYDLSISTERRITIDPKAPQYMPAIYDDKIVYRNGNRDIYMYDLSTSTEIRITTDPNEQSGPAIYGDKIVWDDDRNGNGDIYMYDLSTSTEKRITTDPNEQSGPAIYGDKIVWEDERNGPSDIYMYDLSTSTETRITKDPNAQYMPAIYGDKIVWTDARNGNDDIYMFDLSYSTETRITTNPKKQWSPAIYADRIVWTDERNGNNDIYMAALSWGSGSISINNNARYTKSKNVKLTLSAKCNIGRVDKMIISSRPDFSGANWENFASSKSWNLTSGDGKKTVYVKYKDKAGNVSEIYSDSIILQTEKKEERIAGEDRIKTAIEISKKWEKVDAVVLATAYNFPDALAGAPLAAKHDAPILLSRADSLDEEVKNEIVRLKAKKVIMLGGKVALSKKVENTLKGMKLTVERVYGEDRYGTAYGIAKNLGKNKDNIAIISTGQNFPDALSVSSYAAFKIYPIILVDEKENAKASAKKALQEVGIKQTIIVGGKMVVSDSIENWLKRLGSPKKERLFGKNRYETSIAIAKYVLKNGMFPDLCYVATGEDFPDALACGPLAVKDKSPIILTMKDEVPPVVKNFFSEYRKEIKGIYIVSVVGGPKAVSDKVKNELFSIIK